MKTFSVLTIVMFDKNAFLLFQDEVNLLHLCINAIYLFKLKRCVFIATNADIYRRKATPEKPATVIQKGLNLT